jgi:hypothetical protein
MENNMKIFPRAGKNILIFCYKHYNKKRKQVLGKNHSFI